jgi:hypothetical protein
MYDSVTVSEIPADAGAVLGYIDGDYVTFPELERMFPNSNLLSTTVNHTGDAEVLDCEPGDVPSSGPEPGQWVRMQLGRGRYRPCPYASRDNMPAVLASIRSLGIKRSQHRILSAHYGIGPHICSPVSCGASFTADGTQWTDVALGRNLDESLLADGFFRPAPAARPAPRVHPKVAAAGVTGAIVTAIQAVLHAKHLAITPAEASGITTAAATIAGYFTPSSKAA